MINTTLNILKDKLNDYFRIKAGTDKDLVNYIVSDGTDPGVFPKNTVAPFLINISEDRQFRNADQFVGSVTEGIRTNYFPEIRIELLVLFVAKFNDYDQSLKFISYVIKYFQANRVFNPENTPRLYDEQIEKLTLELISIPLEEQNQVWHSLNTSYLPSVLYKIRLLSFNDEETIQFTGTGIEETVTQIRHK
ncbi:MAG: DUF4255 domain-containing protein [Cyclobacteriaceae bacterium]